MDNNNDLYLRYEFTDRGGKFVYGVYNHSDTMLQKRLKEIRMFPLEGKPRCQESEDEG